MFYIKIFEVGLDFVVVKLTELKAADQFLESPVIDFISAKSQSQIVKNSTKVHAHEQCQILRDNLFLKQKTAEKNHTILT